MSHASENVRTDATEALLNASEQSLDAWVKLDFGPVMESQMLRNVVSSVRRAVRQFDSKLFFVVIFGPLKAGKSTLTNALAGEYVSPTGPGKETTQQPAMIIQAAETGIDQYFQRDVEAENRHEAFDQVADYLRGLIGLDELRRTTETQTFPLNPQELERRLTGDTGRKPLMTVIRVPGGHLINQQVAVVDTPGLDGNRTNWQENPVFDWVVQRADFFLFVQSSVAALNKDTRGFLEQVVNKTKMPPVWLIQNIIDAKYWLDETQRKREATEQRDQALQRVMDLLELPDHKSPPITGLNLGLAWDGIRAPNEEWIAKSEFREFERQIYQRLMSERALIQERNCVRGFSKACVDCIEDLGKVKSRILQFQTECRQFLDALGECFRIVRAIDYRAIGLRQLVAEVGHVADEAVNRWREHAVHEAAALKTRHSRQLPGEQLNQILEAFTRKVAESGDRDFFQNQKQLPGYQKVAVEHLKLAELEAITSANLILKELKLPELPRLEPPKLSDIPSMGDNPFTVVPVGIRKWWGPAKKYPADKIDDEIDGTLKQILQEQVNRVEVWKKDLAAKHLSVYCEHRRSVLEEFLAHQQTEFERHKRPELARAEAAMRMIASLENGLRELGVLSADAMESVRGN